VYTDWLLVGRLAAELDQAVRSARIRDVGMTPDGRFALRVRARGAGGDALVVDAFADTPLVTLEHVETLEHEPGWPRAVAEAIVGMRVEHVRARRGDRLVALDCATLSRFGVLSRYRLVFELVPRFGNILLLRDDVVVAAAREFSAAENPRRPIVAGRRYEPPPLPATTLTREGLTEALRAVVAGPRAQVAAAAARALRAATPIVPALVATSVVASIPDAAWANPDALAALLSDQASVALATAEAGLGLTSDVYVYREDARIVQAHVAPLAQFARLPLERRSSLLEVVREAAAVEGSSKRTGGTAARRASLLRRMRRRAEWLEGERQSLERLLAQEPEPAELQTAGNLLYTYLADVPPGAAVFVPASDPSVRIDLDPELDARENAARIFKRYRKAVGRRAQARRRLLELSAETAAADELLWELERADDAELEELSAEVDRVAGRAAGRRPGTQPRRTALEVRLGEDARVLVGRSPANNADLTFRIARPHDVWFHARGVPGAHVVLRIDSAREPTGAELRAAAELAAYHSKARTSGLVPVDYTPRKYVRKRQNALPGLVWYTNAKTMDVSPRAATG
jgi:predicted ribosome quality control (RQC) complex YloA/Tae2 family protein